MGASQLILFKFPASQVALISAFPLYSLHNILGLSSLKRHFQIWGGNWNCGAALRAARPGAWEDSLIRPRAATSEDSGKWGAFFPQAGCGRAWPLSFLFSVVPRKKCASSGSPPGVRFLCSRESVKYFHVKWRTVGISRNLSFEGLLKFNKDQLYLKEKFFFFCWRALRAFGSFLQLYLILLPLLYNAKFIPLSSRTSVLYLVSSVFLIFILLDTWIDFNWWIQISAFNVRNHRTFI